VAFSPDGNWVATGGNDAASVLDAATGRTIVRLPHDRPVTVVAFSADGRWLATESADSMRIFDASSHTEVRHTNWTGRFAGFSTDGGKLITVAGTTAHVFEVASGKELSKFTLPRSTNSLKLSGDGRWVAMADALGARVFETTSGREMSRMIAGGHVWTAHFVEQDRFLVVTSLPPFGDELLITRHLLRPKDMIDEACARLTRNLTQEEWVQYFGTEHQYHRTCPNFP
jgi:WD40 repeat protein